jgi:hypothetical protein
MERKVNEKVKLVQIFLSKASSPGPSVFEVHTNKAGDLTCTCPGFNGRRSCKHTKFVTERFESNDGVYPMEISKHATEEEIEAAQENPELFRKFILKHGKIEVL